MYTFEYKLEYANIRDMNYYVALHDKKIQMKCLSLAISIACMISLVLAIVLGIRLLTLVLAVCVFVASLVFFPKIYWKTIFNRIDQKLQEAKGLIRYNSIKVAFNTIGIEVTDDKKEYCIEYENISAYDFTKNNCLLFYNDSDTKRQNSLIIPVSCMSNDIQGVCSVLKERVVGVNG